MYLSLYTPEEVMLEVAQHAKATRLSLELTQVAVASRSGVSLASVKRFEATGQISLRSLVRIALVLGVLDKFLTLFIPDKPKPNSIAELLKPEKPLRKRGRRS